VVTFVPVQNNRFGTKLARPLAGQRWMCFSTFPVSSQSLFTDSDLARDSADAERSGTGC